MNSLHSSLQIPAPTGTTLNSKLILGHVVLPALYCLLACSCMVKKLISFSKWTNRWTCKDEGTSFNLVCRRALKRHRYSYSNHYEVKRKKTTFVDESLTSKELDRSNQLNRSTQTRLSVSEHIIVHSEHMFTKWAGLIHSPICRWAPKQAPEHVHKTA